MFRMKSTFFISMLMILVILTVGLTAEAVLKKYSENDVFQESMFDAEISFTVLTGEGCACEPIEGAFISAYGGEGNDSDYTDENGMCVLNLVILGEYTVYIEVDGYLNVYYEFNVLDDQTFIIHMFEKKESANQQLTFFQTILTKMLNELEK